ncbi:MAG: right-handed parallel beta-helix repeat-containing protein [Victivallaceae bacterium]|nr:right-handed parallel beta-helix repeat-containing protein [Victivallaceae bacterium]
MKTIVTLLMFFSIFVLSADEIFVNSATGSDSNSGTLPAPLRTFPTALAKAKPGDTIRMMPVDQPVHGSFMVKDKNGIPDKPIIVDGGFNTYIGTSPINEKQWEMVEPGLYKRVRSNVAKSMLGRYFMCFNGQINRMGRPGKWRGAELKKLEELNDYEWTVVNNTDFYFRIPANKTPSDCKVEEPVLISGVQLSGESSHLVFRNMIVKNFWNDGYNIHGNCRDILFENVVALYNGDDGISAHGTCRITVRNFIAIGNSTGICHVNDSEGIHENIYIAKTAARDLFMVNRKNTFRNVAIEGNSPGGIEFTYSSKQKGILGESRLEQCFFYSMSPGGKLAFSSKSKVTAHDVISYNYQHGRLPDNWQIADNPEMMGKHIAKLKEQLFAIFKNKLKSYE